MGINTPWRNKHNGVWQKQKARYYSKHSARNYNSHLRYTKAELDLIMSKEIPDVVLCSMLNRTLQAIQGVRHKKIKEGL